jgi:DNA primase
MIGAERFSERQAITTAIRNRADLLALAQMATEHKMRRAGSQYRGPCPLHGGTHDNFAVDPTHGVYYCHVCGGKGDAFSFVRAWRDCTFADARRFLAAEVGMRWSRSRAPYQSARISRVTRSVSAASGAEY